MFRCQYEQDLSAEREAHLTAPCPLLTKKRSMKLSLRSLSIYITAVQVSKESMILDYGGMVL